MKKLQNDFTTPEQSKRLLELGLPADSANGAVAPNGHVDYLNSETFTQFAKRIYISVEACPYKPSWSVGRLIEIYIKAKELDMMSIEIAPNKNFVEDMIDIYEMSVGVLDFSKLEN